MSITEFTAMPALFRHCIATYRAMEAEASWRETDEGKTALVYEGRLTALITQDLEMSLPYYTSIRHALQDMDCILQLRRGGGTTGSQWELLQEPSRVLWDEKNLGRTNNQKASTKEQGDQRLRDVRHLIGDLDDRLNVLEEELKNLYESVRSLGKA